MTSCRHCGAPLPPGALFCGECGRSVTAPLPGESTTPRSRLPYPGITQPEIVLDDADVTRRVSMPDAVSPSTGSVTLPVREEDVVPEAVAPEPVVAPEPESESEPDAWSVFAPLLGDDQDTDDESVDDLGGSDEGRVDEGRVDEGRVDEGRVDERLAEEDRTGPDSAPAPTVLPAPPILPVPSIDPGPSGAPASAPAPEPSRDAVGGALHEDLERTRLSAPESAAPVYVLQFSTGESVTVRGTGLVGRNPSAEPGEYVDHLVTLFDAGRSVSKTHLEFGQEAGRFWVSDRFSTNGSVIRQPDEQPHRTVPGRRYLVARGTRIDIGEQFFVVS